MIFSDILKAHRRSVYALEVVPYCCLLIRMSIWLVIDSREPTSGYLVAFVWGSCVAIQVTKVCYIFHYGGQMHSCSEACMKMF